MSQINEARAAVKRLYANALDRDAVVKLHHALEDSQNGPPHGVRDGTIGEELWYQLKDIEFAFLQVQTVTKKMREGR